MSLRDGAVLQMCQQTLARVMPSYMKQLPLLKACLSYTDSLHPLPPAPTAWPSAAEGAGGKAAVVSDKQTDAPLESYWAVPLLSTFFAPDQKGSAASREEVDGLIECFLALQAVPKPLIGIGGAKGKAAGLRAGGASPQAEALVVGADKPLADHLARMLSAGGVDSLLLPYAQRLSVGFFSAPTTAFVYDLCMLAGWEQLQPAFAAALISMREGLLTSTDAASLRVQVRHGAQQLTVTQLQRTLATHFMADVRARLDAPPPERALELAPGGY